MVPGQESFVTLYNDPGRDSITHRSDLGRLSPVTLYINPSSYKLH